MPTVSRDDDYVQLRWQLEILEFEQHSDRVLAGYARLYVLLLATIVAATFLPLGEESASDKPGGDLWQAVGSFEVSPRLVLASGLVLVFLGLVVSTVLWPRGEVKPLAVLVLAVVLSVALLNMSGPSRFPDRGALALWAGFGFTVVLSAVHSVHAIVIQRRHAKLVADSAGDEH